MLLLINILHFGGLGQRHVQKGREWEENLYSIFCLLYVELYEESG
jgi:hypothetical protein